MAWFDLPFNKIEQVFLSIEKDTNTKLTVKSLGTIKASVTVSDHTKRNVSVSHYLDKVLIPRIKELAATVKEDDQFSRFFLSNAQSKFRGLISLCFSGDLSQKAWAEVCEYLTQDEILFYCTTYYHLGESLEIAARGANLPALESLRKIFKKSLQTSTRQTHAHAGLVLALRRLPPYIRTNLHIKAYETLLDMCYELSILIDSNGSKTDLSNRKFLFKQYGLFVSHEEETPLLEIFLYLCEHYICFNDPSNRNVWALKKINNYVNSIGSPEDVRQFQNGLLDLLKKVCDRLDTLHEDWKISSYLHVKQVLEQILGEKRKEIIEVTVEEVKIEEVIEEKEIVKTENNESAIIIPDVKKEEEIIRLLDDVIEESNIEINANNKEDFLQQLENRLQNTIYTRKNILDFFHEIKNPTGQYSYIHAQNNPNWDGFRLFFKPNYNPDEENFWHTETYKNAVRQLKAAYLGCKDDADVDDREDAFIDYLRGNPSFHPGTTTARDQLTEMRSLKK